MNDAPHQGRRRKQANHKPSRGQDTARTPIRPLWQNVAEILIVFGSAAVIIAGGFRIVGNHVIGRQAVVWVANIAMIATVVLALRRRGESVADIGVVRPQISIASLAKLFGASLLAFVFAVAAFVLGSIVMANIIGIPESADMSSYDFLAGNLPLLVLTLAGVFVAASFGEEFVYRGFVTTRLAELFGGQKRAWILAAIASSVLFGFAHYDWGWMGIVQTTFMGGALATSWLKARRNLWVVVLAHAYMDAILMIEMYLAASAG